MLFITFVKEYNLEDKISQVTNILEKSAEGYKVFTYKNKRQPEYYIVYNATNELSNDIKSLGSTIIVQRNSEFNVIYTINSLNNIIKAENNGQLDTSYKVDWEKYRNRILLEDKSGNLTANPIDLVKICTKSIEENGEFKYAQKDIG
jgi:hypothetical protein